MVEVKALDTRFGEPGKLKKFDLAVFTIVLLFTSLAIFVPFSPNLPEQGLDPAWSMAVNQALEQNLTFGRDIVFTYGPYASVYTWLFHPATDGLILFASAYLAASYFLAAFLYFRASGWVLRAFFLLALATVYVARDALFYSYPLMIGLLLCRHAEEPRAHGGSLPSPLLVAILFAPLGLLPLVKVSFLFACLGVMLPCAALLIILDHPASAAAVLLSPVLSVILFAALAHQPMTALPLYFSSAVPLVSGYAEAMSIDGPALDLGFFALCSAILIWRVACWKSNGMMARWSALMMLTAILFVSFKGAFVRHDEHAANGGVMIIMAALLLSPLTSRTLEAVTLFGVAIIGLIGVAHERDLATNPVFLLRFGSSTYSSALEGAFQRITNPDRLDERFKAALHDIAMRENIPLLQGRTDTYPYDQAGLIASGNAWAPRPVFQSYSAYTPELAELNRDHLLGESRPDNLLIKVQPIDGRLPALDDGPSWRVMLARYRLTGMAGGALVLSHASVTEGISAMNDHALSGTYELGQSIDLSTAQDLVFARIRLTQTLYGRLRSALYKPSQLRIRLSLADGRERTFRLIPEMAQSEFLLSPLIERTSDFGSLLEHPEALSGSRVTTLAVSEAGNLGEWENMFELDLMTAPNLR